MFWRKSARPASNDDDTSIGSILVKTLIITEAQLQRAISRKAQHDDYVLGSMLREMGLCTEEQIARALLIQARLRKGDVAEATLRLMELRIDAYSDGEGRLGQAIETAKKEERGVWHFPFSPAR